MMFIREEVRPGDLRREFNDADLLVWSPIACRHTSWTFEPLCKCDERGKIIRGSRRRCPFITRTATKI